MKRIFVTCPKCGHQQATPKKDGEITYCSGIKVNGKKCNKSFVVRETDTVKSILKDSDKA